MVLSNTMLSNAWIQKLELNLYTYSTTLTPHNLLNTTQNWKIEEPPRDKPTISQYFETLYSYTEAERKSSPSQISQQSNEQGEMKKNATSRCLVPTVRITKVVKFGKASRAKKSRFNPNRSAQWRHELSTN